MPVHKMCRICLAEDKARMGMQPLFDEKNIRCAEIVQRIEECGGIVLKHHEEFPTMICFQCLDSLNTSYKFRLMCQSSEQALLDAIVKSELKTEPIEFATSSNSGPIKTKSNGDDEDENEEMFFDLRSDFIEGQEVDFDELGDTKHDYSDNDRDDDFFVVEEQDLDEIDGEEHLDDSDTENEVEKLIDDDEFVPIPKKKKSKTNTKVGKKPRAKNATNKSSGEKPQPKVRGRKKKPENESESNICEICGNIYAKRSLLNMHMRRHRSEKPFECEICGKQFTCPSEIGRHIRIHTGEKPYVCRFCGRTFADRSTNIKHERIHTNERPFTCQTCGKSFTYSNVLKNHMLTHTGEKPFPCLPCNKTFSRKHQLDQHLSTITHQQTVKNLLPQTVQAQDGTEFRVQINDTRTQTVESNNE
ncbi:transcription factor Ouib [Stomoxys calcitrans]|uniref:transcription factor Ouib n=1 Tax=Stomoxys calcitrans TaxID=35570 RepID=UPI0027E2C8DE|nr:transcription factor Ouib [Stomoxys calcitrans]